MNRKPVVLSRRWMLGALLSGAAMPVWADAPIRSLVPRPRPGDAEAEPAFVEAPRKVSATPVADLIAAAQLGGTVGYVVADARTGLVLESAEAGVGLPPASVAKVLTTLYALDALGPEHRFATRLIATGAVQGGTIAGDLVLAGSGDPTLSTDMLAAMAKALKARGVTRVAGRFLVWGGALPAIDQIDPGQPEHVGYNPAISGLNLNFNRVYFEWRRGGNGYDVSMDARSELHRPRVRMATMQVVGRESPLYTFSGSGGVDGWTVARGALGNSGSRWLPVRHPALYSGEAFQALAAAQGITLPQPVAVAQLPRGTALVTQPSEDLRTILRDMLRFSTNMTAEVVGLTASAARGGSTATLVASARRMNDWLARTYGVKSAGFVDHSGLGSASRISAADLVRTLVKAGPSGPLRAILRDYPLRNAAGDVVTRPGLSVSAKTGTLNFVSALAGYIRTPDGSDLAFAIFCADPGRRDRVPMAEREEPEGGPAWTKRARRLHQGLIERWSTLYGT